MANLLENADIIRQQAQLFDDVRPAGLRLFLLKRAGQSQKFAVVAEIAGGWFGTFDKEFRDEMKISIATESNIADEIAQSSFLAYGFGAAGDELDVFSFDRKDACRPNATSPSWKIHTKRDAAERFTIPV